MKYVLKKDVWSIITRIPISDSNLFRKEFLHKRFKDINWSIDEAKIKSEDYTAISRLLMGVLAIKYNIMIHLIDDVTIAFQQILTQQQDFKSFKRLTPYSKESSSNQSQPKVHCEPIEEDEVHVISKSNIHANELF
jgi:hypothetical protein